RVRQTVLGRKPAHRDRRRWEGDPPGKNRGHGAGSRPGGREPGTGPGGPAGVEDRRDRRRAGRTPAGGGGGGARGRQGPRAVWGGLRGGRGMLSLRTGGGGRTRGGGKPRRPPRLSKPATGKLELKIKPEPPAATEKK